MSRKSKKYLQQEIPRDARPMQFVDTLCHRRKIPLEEISLTTVNRLAKDSSEKTLAIT
jgi:hypothetical protein